MATDGVGTYHKLQFSAFPEDFHNLYSLADFCPSSLVDWRCRGADNDVARKSKQDGPGGCSCPVDCENGKIGCQIASLSAVELLSLPSKQEYWYTVRMD